MNKLKKYWWLAVGLVLIGAVIFWWFIKTSPLQPPPSVPTVVESAKPFAPEFLSIEEKKKLYMPEDLKVQVLTRDKSGELMIYKIIKDDSEIVDPASLKATRLPK